MIHTKGALNRLWNWLKAEGALCWKQASCPHLDADEHWRHPCPDCGYTAKFEVTC